MKSLVNTRQRTALIAVATVLLLAAGIVLWSGARVVLAPMQNAACGQFADVAANHPACGAILKLAAQGVINGYPDGTFQPDNHVTRAEFAKMTVVAFGHAPTPAAPHLFPDVAGHWATTQGYAQAAIAIGAINGFEDFTFRPNEPVTRAQAVKITAASLRLYPAGAAPYADIRPLDWHAGWVAVGHQSRLIGPQAANPLWSGTNFGANVPTTRAEAAMLLANLPNTSR